MANYFTEASFVVPLNSDQCLVALAVLKCLEDESIDLRKRRSITSKSVSNEVYALAKKLSKVVDDYSPGEVVVNLSAVQVDDGLWISHDEYIDLNLASEFVRVILKGFNLDIGIGIEASHSCSRKLTDAYGGTAIFVTKNSIKWMSTSCRLAIQVKI